MENIPQGAIPVSDFQAADAPQSQDNIPAGAIPVDQFQSQEEAYGGKGEALKTALEGAAHTVLPFGIAEAAEKRYLNVKPEDIKGRAEAHPVARIAGEIAGFTSPIGVENVMTKAGTAAAEAAGLAGAKTFGAKVGEAAVKQAAEMAVLQSSDEVAKRVIQDEPGSAASAIANIGLASAIGAGLGTAGVGVISPLWKATVGPKVEEMLNMMKNHVNGGGKLLLPEEREAAVKTLGIDVDPLARAAVSDDAKARNFVATLKRGENQEMFDALDKLKADSSNSVAQALNIDLSDIARYDNNVAGHDLYDTFRREYEAKYQPIAEALEARNKAAAKLPLSDEAKLAQRDALLESAMEKLRPGSEYYQVYQKYGQEILPLDNIGHLDQLRTEIYNKIKGLTRTGSDDNMLNALKDIRDKLGEFQEKEINKMGAAGEDINKFRKAANIDYANFARMSNDLSNHLGVGDFKGFGKLTGTLENKLTPEQLLKRFSIKNNQDMIPFLTEHFPDTLNRVIENERKELLKPAVLSANKKGEVPIDIKQFKDIIDKNQAGRAGYLESVIPKLASDRVEAANTLLNAIPSPRDSGTPAGIAKLLEHLPTSALAAVGWFTGHGALSSILVGESASKLGMKAPEAYRLAYLKFLASEQPVKPGAFKATVDFLHNVYKSENTLKKGVSNLLKRSSEVIPTHLIPTEKDRQRLDQSLQNIQKDPQGFMTSQGDSDLGHYLPGHQAAAAMITTRAANYLQSIKPKGHSFGPLDKPLPPTPVEENRYNRALDIAQQPAILLKYMKDGTLKLSDIQDINGMYPEYFQNMISQISNNLGDHFAGDDLIPYKTRISLSLALGQPLSASMQPQAIISAQPQPKPQFQAPRVSKNTAKIGNKTNNMYKTASQEAEGDRSARS